MATIGQQKTAWHLMRDLEDILGGVETATKFLNSREFLNSKCIEYGDILQLAFNWASKKIIGQDINSRIEKIGLRVIH